MFPTQMQFDACVSGNMMAPQYSQGGTMGLLVHKREIHSPIETPENPEPVGIIKALNAPVRLTSLFGKPKKDKFKYAEYKKRK